MKLKTYKFLLPSNIFLWSMSIRKIFLLKSEIAVITLKIQQYEPHHK